MALKAINDDSLLTDSGGPGTEEIGGIAPTPQQALTATLSGSGTTTPTTTSTSTPNPFITIPGTSFTPDDYNNFIQGDPGYMGLKNSLGANEDAFHAALRGAVQKSILSSGYNVPEAAQFLDPGQADQAAQNPYSTLALAGQAHAQNLRQIQNALAARGGYDSGELTYGVGNEASRFNQEDMANRGQMADYIAGLLGQESTLKGNDAAQLASELGNATSRQFALHPTTGSQTANYDSSTGTYIDSYGNHYDASGKLLSTAPAPSGGSPNPTPTPSLAPYPYPTPAAERAAAEPYAPLPPTEFSSQPNVGQSTNIAKLLGLPV